MCVFHVPAILLWNRDILQLTVGSTSRKAVSIPLAEMDQKDAIVYAATVFSEVSSPLCVTSEGLSGMPIV